MGYQHRVYTFNCGECSAPVLVHPRSWQAESLLPRKSDCPRCGGRNFFRSTDPMPNLPSLLYIGHDKHRQVELYPSPPGSHAPDGMFPYSTRSFIYQVARQLGGCAYGCSPRGDSMGEPVFKDWCAEPVEGYWGDGWACHILAGWTKGQQTCLLWEEVATLCQTETERKFLYQYMGLVKSRNFPMLIPQARIGIAERRRPDFVLFVPLQHLKYRRYA